MQSPERQYRNQINRYSPLSKSPRSGSLTSLDHQKSRFFELSTWLTAGATAALAVVTFLPVGAWLLSPLENQFPATPRLPDAVDGIITLGGGIDLEVSAGRGQLATNEEAERLVTLATVARRYPQAHPALSGGSGKLFGSGTSEAAVIKRILMGLGVDLERVVFKDRSRNTFENARYSKDLIVPKPDECWLLITSAYHMPRGRRVSEGRMGCPALPGGLPDNRRTTVARPAGCRASTGGVRSCGAQLARAAGLRPDGSFLSTAAHGIRARMRKRRGSTARNPRTHGA